jgi:uncharacterized protein
MPITMYQASIPPMIRALDNLGTVLQKGADYAEAKRIDPSVLLGTRLYPDMFPLSRQVQIASDIARRGAARLAGLEAPAIEDNETTFADLVERLQKTTEYLKTFTSEQIDGSEQRSIALPIGDKTLTFEGLPYLVSFILPNVYFHTTTAYGILRHCGIELGKMDYLGKP